MGCLIRSVEWFSFNLISYERLGCYLWWCYQRSSARLSPLETWKRKKNLGGTNKESKLTTDSRLQMDRTLMDGRVKALTISECVQSSSLPPFLSLNTTLHCQRTLSCFDYLRTEDLCSAVRHHRSKAVGTDKLYHDMFEGETSPATMESTMRTKPWK